MWVSVKDRLPEIPAGQFRVDVIVATFDATYASLQKDKLLGYDVWPAFFDGIFKGDLYGYYGDTTMVFEDVTPDPVIFWQYYPSRPETLPENFKEEKWTPVQ